MTGLWLSKSRQGWGRCRTTRSPRVPDASSGVSRGPHNSDFGWGRRQAMGGKVARAPRYASLLGVSGLSGRRYSGRAGCVRLSSLNTYAAPIVRVAGIGHPCYPVPVTIIPRSPTIHSSLPTMEHPCPILSHFVPPCSTPDRASGTPVFHFPPRVFHPPDTNGTERNTLERITQTRRPVAAPSPRCRIFSYPLSTVLSRGCMGGTAAGRVDCARPGCADV